MNIVETIKDVIGSSMQSLTAKRDEARRRQLAARVAYAEEGSVAAREEMDRAEHAYAAADRDVRAHEALEL